MKTSAFLLQTTVLLLLSVFPSRMSAQKSGTIYGGVFNSVTRERLTGVKVELLDRNHAVIDSMRNRPKTQIADRPGAWFFEREGRHCPACTVRFKADGYEVFELPVDSFSFRRRELARFIADVYLERTMKQKTLGEVTVKATKVKVYARGDTVVYNADAFQLTEGSMLDALIRQLPGVELKDDGRILVNGRYVENLLLNGEDFFKGDPSVLLQNLPSYAVKDVKVYDKDGRLSEFMERKAGDEELVMDVRLKREYSVGWLGNAETGYGTEERYRAHFFGLRFTPHTRVSAFGNLNNMNESQLPRANGTWTPAQLTGGLRADKLFGIDYMVNGRDGKYKLNGNASYRHFDTDVRTRTSGVNFLPDGDTYEEDSHGQAFCQTWIHTAHDFQFNWPKAFLRLQPSFRWGQWNDRNTYLSGTFHTDPEPYFGQSLLDSLAHPAAGDLLRRIAINRSRREQQNRGERTNAALRLNSSVKTGLGNDNLNLHANIQYQDYKQRWHEHYRLDYPSGGGATDFRNQYTDDDGPTRNMNYDLGGEYWLWLPHNLAVVPGYNYHWHDHDKRYELYRLDQLAGWGEEDGRPLGMLPSESEHLAQTMDRANSYWSHLTDQSHKFSLYVKWEGYGKRHKGTYWYLILDLPLMPVWQELDYRRDRIDTTVSRRHVLFEPHFMLWGRWKNRSRGFRLEYRKRQSFPAMTSYIDIRTTDDPLNLTLSNTGLKNTHRHEVSFYFYRNDNPKNRHFNTYWSYSVTQNAVAQGYIYNKETGVRTYRPENVNGNYDVGGNLHYDMQFHRHKPLDMTADAWSRLYHSVDLIGVTEGTAPQRSTVQNVNSGGKLSFNYTFQRNVKVGAKAACTWNHLTSRREDFVPINAFDFNYGLTAQAGLPWGLQFNTDLTLYSRRGYEAQGMNTDDVVWNATLSKRFLKNRLILSVDGFDILGQLSATTQTLNGQGRTETWRNVLPSYAMLRLAYRLDIKPAKRPGG